MKKKILITGANGFIGSNLVAFLLKDKVPVELIRLFVETNTELSNLPKKKFDIIKGDIRNKGDVKKAMEGVETVYHLAALAGFGANTYQKYKEVNVDGTQNILDLCINRKIQKFVFFSSIAVYGLPAWIGNICNWDETHEHTYSEIYGQSKHEAEKRVIRMYEKHKVPYTIIRPVSVYGPHDKGQLYGLYKAIKNHHFFMIGDGNNKMDFVYVQDLLTGVRKAQLSKRDKSDYILAGPEPIKFKDIVMYVAKSIHHGQPKYRLSTQSGMIIAYISDFICNLAGIRSPIFPSRVKVMTRSYYYNRSKAFKEIGYYPETSFELGTTITGKWYLDNQYI